MRERFLSVMHNLCLVAFIVLCMSGAVFSQTTGKIVGTVVDKQTNDPLPGANVLVVGTNLGAAADVMDISPSSTCPPGCRMWRCRLWVTKE